MLKTISKKYIILALSITLIASLAFNYKQSKELNITQGEKDKLKDLMYYHNATQLYLINKNVNEIIDSANIILETRDNLDLQIASKSTNNIFLLNNEIQIYAVRGIIERDRLSSLGRYFEVTFSSMTYNMERAIKALEDDGFTMSNIDNLEKGLTKYLTCQQYLDDIVNTIIENERNGINELPYKDIENMLEKINKN